MNLPSTGESVDLHGVEHREVYHVLIIDDDPAFRASHKRSLEFTRFMHHQPIFHVADAEGGETALVLVRSRKFDCVLLDYRLPGEDGLALMDRILAEDPGLAIIILTGAGGENIAVDSMKRGATDYLTKGNLTMEQLQGCIVDAVSKVRMLRHVELQFKDLMRSERQRVMLDTLTAACHHLSQPVTVIRCCLVMLKRKETTPEEQDLIIKAFVAIEKVADIIWKLQHVSEFKTEVYLQDQTRQEDMLTI